MKRTLLALFAVVVLSMSMASIALANGAFLNVDGVVYSPSQVSGPVNHYNTPDTSPSSAFSDRHTWVGNGSELLPCPFGIHWVDNANVLTISHCLEGETTTTTINEETTTTSEATTTTTSVIETTTTTSRGTTTTSESVTTTTTPEETSTTTTVVSVSTTTPGTLPETGTGSVGLAVAAFAALMLGYILIKGVHDD